MNWKRTKWWRAIGPDVELWCESSNQKEVLMSARDGDRIENLWSTESEYEWREAGQTYNGTRADLNNIQQEISKWHDYNFPDTPLEFSMLGLAEEVGEACRPLLKIRDGIRGTKEEWMQEFYKELGDVLITTLKICGQAGWSAEEVLEDRWNIVKQLDFHQDSIAQGLPKE